MTHQAAEQGLLSAISRLENLAAIADQKRNPELATRRRAQVQVLKATVENRATEYAGHIALVA